MSRGLLPPLPLEAYYPNVFTALRNEAVKMDDALVSVDVKPVAPDYITPDEFAKHYGWSPRKIREIARKIGACRIMGNRMILLQEDIDAILEFSRPK